ncbi:MAG: toxic anion resistance protein [Candidatus Peribacteria bacterium]|jgi:uncharacterized protein YaaN involved in tellurite resistance|nr:toxic anion resistance protein [Candidatus Peribacteria bacterium]
MAKKKIENDGTIEDVAFVEIQEESVLSKKGAKKATSKKGGGESGTVPEKASIIKKRLEEVSPEALKEAELALNRTLTDKDIAKIGAIMKSTNIFDTEVADNYGETENKVIDELSKRADQIKIISAGELGQKLKSVKKDFLKRKRSREMRNGIVRKVLDFFQDTKDSLDVEKKSVDKNISDLQEMFDSEKPKSVQNSVLLDKIWEENAKKYDDLRLHRIAGDRLVLEGRTQLALKRAETPTDNIMAIQGLNDDEEKIAKFERTLYDIETSRHLALQAGVKVKMLKKVNERSLENVKTVVTRTLPILRQELVIEGIANDVQALSEITKMVSDMTEDAIIHSAQHVAEVSVAVATQSERPLVSITTFKKANDLIFKGIEKTIEISIKGAEDRENDLKEFADMEKETARILLMDPSGKKFLNGGK